MAPAKKDAGYHVPPLPIALVDANTEKEAREKILVLSSQCGEMTEETLDEFPKD